MLLLLVMQMRVLMLVLLRNYPRCAMVPAAGAQSGCVEAARGWSLHGSAPVMVNA